MDTPITDADGLWDAKDDGRFGYVRGRSLRRGGRFNVLSLGNWVTLAAMADVPAVPLVYLGALDAHELMRLYDLMDGDGPDPDAPPLALEGINRRLNALEGEWMARCDGVSGDAVKVEMSRKPYPGEDRATFRRGVRQGMGFHRADDGQRFFVVDDARLDECVSEWVEADCPVWARPLVKARMIEGAEAPYQAEWRVFVEDGAIVAASTYYPQAPRGCDDRDRAALSRSLAHVSAMLEAMRSHGLVPHHRRYEGREHLDLSAIHCALDFIETADGEVLLLEGGPAFLTNPSWGAHACAFAADRSSEDVGRVSGIAWGGGVFDGPEVLAELVAEASAGPSGIPRNP